MRRFGFGKGKKSHQDDDTPAADDTAAADITGDEPEPAEPPKTANEYGEITDDESQPSADKKDTQDKPTDAEADDKKSEKSD